MSKFRSLSTEQKMVASFLPHTRDASFALPRVSDRSASVRYVHISQAAWRVACRQLRHRDKGFIQRYL